MNSTDMKVDESEDGSTRVVTVTVRHTNSEQPWHDRDKLMELERVSSSKWDSLDTEERRALALIVTDIFRRLCEDPEIWMPTSLIPRTGHNLDVWIGFKMDEIDNQVIHLRAEAERQLNKTREDLQALDKELADKIPSI